MQAVGQRQAGMVLVAVQDAPVKVMDVRVAEAPLRLGAGVGLGMTLARRAATGMLSSGKKPAKTQRDFNELQN